MRTGVVELTDGRRVGSPLAYVGLAPIRMPLLVDGRPVRCCDVGQEQAQDLLGTAAESQGLDVTPVT